MQFSAFYFLSSCAIMNPLEVIAVRILYFGDSNTYGYDPRGFFGDRYDAGDRWVDLLAKQTSHEIINAGANGREIPRSPYVLRLLTEHAPVDIFLVMLGTNDLLQGASAIEAAARMEAFLNHLLPHCKQILLVAPPPMKRGAWVPTDELVSKSLRLAEEYKLLAENLNIPLLTPATGISNSPSTVSTLLRTDTIPLLIISRRYSHDHQCQQTDGYPILLFRLVLSPSGSRVCLHPQSDEPKTGQPNFTCHGCGGRHCILDEESHANAG